MSSDIAIGALGASSVIGGIDAPMARLCGDLNFIRQHRWEFSLDTTQWTQAAGGGTIEPQVGPSYDPTALLSRNVLLIKDISTSGANYVRAKCNPGYSLAGTSWVFSCWIKAVGGDLTNSNIRAVADAFDESVGDSDGNPGALTEDEWVFFSRVWTWSSTVKTLFYIDFFPCRTTADQGMIAISAPQCRRILANVSDLPTWPMRRWQFEPWVRSKQARNVFGVQDLSRRGWVPRITARHPAADKSQLQAIASIYAHEGPIFFEPNVDSDIAFWMTPDRDRFEYTLVNDRALGYQGALELIGTEPIYGLPDATLYVEEEHVIYFGRPRFVRAV